jgi:primary-amine oxidase
MISFLEGELRGQTHPRPVRAARVQVTIRGDAKPNEMVELIVDLNSGSVIKKEHLVGKHPYIDSAYMQAAEKACRADPRIEAEIQKLKLPAGSQVVVEPWAYATDGMNDVSERTTMVRIVTLETEIQLTHDVTYLVLVLSASSRPPGCKLLRIPA